MTVRIRPPQITQAEYDAVYHVVGTTPRRPPEDGAVTIAEMTRADGSRLLVEARRPIGGGVMRYFLRNETLRDATEAAGGDEAPLDLGGAPVTWVSFGDADGDGHNDIYMRTADTPDDDDAEDQFYVITSSGTLGEIVPTPETTEPPSTSESEGAGAGGQTPPRTAENTTQAASLSSRDAENG